MKYVIPKTSVIADFYGKARKLHGRTEVHGMQISIENARGTVRHWYDPHSKENGSTRMLYDYGYIRGTEGTDGDHVDCYIGPHPESESVYVVTQMKKPDFSEVDEQKVMLGFTSAKKAKTAYLAHYDDARFFGGMKKMHIDAFKAKVFKKENRGELVRSILTLADLVKAAHPEGAGWMPIPGGHKHGFRRRKGSGWEYWYPGEEKPQASHVAHEWKTATRFSEEQFRAGDFDKDPTHWHWRVSGGEMKPWIAGGVDPHSHAPVKVGGRFAKLYTIEVPEDPTNPGFAILRAVDDGAKIMMQHNRIFSVDHDPLRRARVEAPEAETKPAWTPTGGTRQKPSSGRPAAGKTAPVFGGSTANKETQPGLYAIENGVYPMRVIERFEVNEDGSKRKTKMEAIAVSDHGKNLLVKEFEPLIASTAKKIAKQFALQMQYEKGVRGGRAVNTTLVELQRAGIEGLLDAIERYDAKNAFTPHAQQFVRDHVRIAAARERLGGVSLPMRHQRNIARYVAARAQAAKALGVDDPTPEQVMPYFKLLKRHLHSHLTGAQANEPVPVHGYTIVAVREGSQGVVQRGTGEKVGATEASVERDTVTHPGKLEWAHLYDSFLKGQASARDLFDEDKFALPGLGMGLGYSPEERVAIRQAVQRTLGDLSEFEFTSEGRKKITYKGDAGEMLALRLGLYGDDEMSTSQIAKQVPIYANGKKLEQRRAEEIVSEMIERAINVAREKVQDRDAKTLMTRAAEKLTPPVPVVSGPTWHEIIRKRAADVTPKQIAEYRAEEKARLAGLVERSRDRASQASGPNALQHEHALRAAEEAYRRVDRMSEDEIRMKIATRIAPETAEMRRLMTQTITVDVPPPRGFEYGSMVMTMTDLATGAQRNVRVRTLRDLRSAEDREMEKSRASEKRRADATLTSGMLREAINYPRTMRLLVAPEEQIADAPTIARRTVELLSGLGE
jgi:hypothetical protein